MSARKSRLLVENIADKDDLDNRVQESVWRFNTSKQIANDKSKKFSALVRTIKSTWNPNEIHVVDSRASFDRQRNE